MFWEKAKPDTVQLKDTEIQMSAKRAPLDSSPISGFDLPDEIVMMILRYLSFPQVLQCARVCRQLRDLAYDPVFWRNVDLRPFSSRISDAALALIAPRLHSCTFLSLEHCTAITSLEPLSNHCNALKEASFVGCTGISNEALKSFVQKMQGKALRLINIDRCHGITTRGLIMCHVADPELCIYKEFRGGWKEFIEPLIDEGGAKDAAIFGFNGILWAATVGFTLSKATGVRIYEAFALNKSELAKRGGISFFSPAGYYQFPIVENHTATEMHVVSSDKKTGMYCFRTNQTVIIAIYLLPGTDLTACHEAGSSLMQYMISAGY